MANNIQIRNYDALPKWYNQYETSDVVSVDEINDGAYVVVTTHVVGDGNDTHEYTIWTYESLGSDSTLYDDCVLLKEIVTEWSN